MTLSPTFNLNTFSPEISATGPWDQILPRHLLLPHLLRPVESNRTDHYWMMEAWTESLKNNGLTNPNPAVGCLLVDAHGNEISRGCTQPFPGPHAEKAAFDQVRHPNSLIGATAYVTLEPCAHHGRNAPCADLLANSPIRRVVIARTDPNPLVNQKGIQKLRAAGKEVHTGILTQEVTAWNLGFLTQQVLKRPLIALKWAQTLDGQLADDSMTSRWISDSTSRAYGHWLRQHYDLIIVGAQTVVSDQPQLNVRDCLRPHQAEPLPIILDPRGLLFIQPIEMQNRLKTTTLNPSRQHVVVTTQAVLDKNSNSWLNKLSNLVLLGQLGNQWIPELMNILSGPNIEKILGRPIQSLMIEGGSKTLTQFISAGYGDIFHLFIAPLITGGIKNRIALQKLLNQAVRLNTLSSTRLKSDILIELISEEIKEKIF